LISTWSGRTWCLEIIIWGLRSSDTCIKTIGESAVGGSIRFIIDGELLKRRGRWVGSRFRRHDGVAMLKHSQQEAQANAVGMAFFTSVPVEN